MLINRQNWRDTRQYLLYCTSVRQVGAGTAELYRCCLDCLLLWAMATPLPKAATLRPGFPATITTHSAEYQAKLCTCARGFFQWAKGHLPRYRKVSDDWILSLKPARQQTEVTAPRIFTLDEVRAILTYPAQSLIEERDQAATAFLFLSGMRNSAFCSLPIQAVDLTIGTGQVRQWPSLGVRTKGGKAANTWLLNIPDLRATVAHWDARVRAALPLTAPWWPLAMPDGCTFSHAERGKATSFDKRLRRLCEAAGIEYKSPHSLRHGHAVWALERCQTMADLKAVSQNLMHSSLGITDKIYSVLLDDQVLTHLQGLSEGGSPSPAAGVDVKALAEELLQLMRS